MNVRRYEVHLSIAMLIFAATFVGEILYVRSQGTIRPARDIAALIILPPFLLVLCILSLMHLAWFPPNASTTFKWPKLIFFWMLAAGFCFGFGNMFWSLLFPA
jgi:hypothetical protein